MEAASARDGEDAEGMGPSGRERSAAGPRLGATGFSRRILGVRVDDVTLREAVEWAAAAAAAGRPLQIATVNPEFIMAARRRPAFAALLETNPLNVPDGAGVMGAAWLQGRPLRERVPGVELTLALAERAAREGYRLYLLGAAPGVAAAAAAALKRRFPSLRIVGAEPGDPRPQADGEVRARIARARPQILLVAYGAPKQEFWIRRNLPHLPPLVAVGVGGTFDYLSGRVPRAPRTLRRLGLEWLYRLYRQPWRWRRMAVLPLFALLATLEGVRTRWGTPAAGAL